MAILALITGPRSWRRPSHLSLCQDVLARAAPYPWGIYAQQGFHAFQISFFDYFAKKTGLLATFDTVGQSPPVGLTPRRLDERREEILALRFTVASCEGASRSFLNSPAVSIMT
jgi:hypothetical protein